MSSIEAPADREFVVIDGSLLEGGGQILRNSFGLSTLLGVPIHVVSIRAGRKTPGLRAQHLVGINLLGGMCGGELGGNSLKSCEVKYVPPAGGCSQITGGEYVGSIPSAGSITLLVQASLPPLLFAASPSSLAMTGGTNASFAPQIDFTHRVLLPTLARFGVSDIALDVQVRGFFPKGCGAVQLQVSPVPFLTPITALERGDIVSVDVFAFTAGVIPNHVAEKMALGAVKKLTWWFHQQAESGLCPNPDVEYNVETPHIPKSAAYGTGTGITLVAHTSTGERLVGNALGAKGVPAQDIGRQAADSLIANLRHGGAMGEWLTDQIIVFMGLADGVSSIRTGPLSLHTQTAIHFVSLLTGAEFDVQPAGDGGDAFIITCQGIGFRNPCPDVSGAGPSSS